MTEAEIYRQLTPLFQDVFGDDGIVLTPETTADDIAEWDSFNHINLIVAVETHYKIKFGTAEVEQLKDVGDMVAAIRRKLDR